MVRICNATTDSPLSSNRDRMAPTRPRRTASGLSRRRVRWPDWAADWDCDMGQSLVGGGTALAGGPLALQALTLRALGVHPGTEQVRPRPQRREDDAEQEH